MVHYGFHVDAGDCDGAVPPHTLTQLARERVVQPRSPHAHPWLAVAQEAFCVLRNRLRMLQALRASRKRRLDYVICWLVVRESKFPCPRPLSHRARDPLAVSCADAAQAVPVGWVRALRVHAGQLQAAGPGQGVRIGPRRS